MNLHALNNAPANNSKISYISLIKLETIDILLNKYLITINNSVTCLETK